MVLEAQSFGTNVNSFELTPIFPCANHSYDVFAIVFSVFVLQDVYFLASYCCGIAVFK